MLIEFSTKNFLSFKNLTSLSMVAAKPFKEYQDSHIIETKCNLNLLKSTIIYGSNASGKSNLFKAMNFMKATVLNSFRDALMNNNERKFPLEKFALSTQTEKEPSFFEVSFIQNGIKYRYGFEIDYDRIVSEWLCHTTSKEVFLFKRDLQDIEINKSAFKEGIGKDVDVRENVLFLSLLATLGKEISSEIVHWFHNVSIVNAIYDFGYNYTTNKLKTDKQFLNWVLRFVKFLEIANLSTIEEDVNSIELKISMEKETSDAISTQKKQTKRDQLIVYHRKYDENDILVDTVPFNFDTQESEGTKKLLYLLGPWYDTLQRGKILIIDELDCRLHSHLTSRLIDFFHYSNQNSAQLICAAHDIFLLNREVFRRDQIWFVEKNQFGASDLYSLAEFKKVRNTSVYNKDYSDGKYGAIPYFDMDEKLNELLYEQNTEK